MAISICNPLMDHHERRIFDTPSSREEQTIQIFIPPKPSGMNPGIGATSASASCHGTLTTLSLSSVLSLSSLHPEEDLASSKLPFVWKLYEMLEDTEKNGKEDIASWVDDGRAFRVHKLKSFVEDIIPKYFRQSKYKSFQRQLYFYAFTRTSSGPNCGGYSHPKFIRGVKTLCLSMIPKKTIRRKKKGVEAKAEDSPSAATKAPLGKTESEDPSEWMTQMEDLMRYGADPSHAPQRRRSSNHENAIAPTCLQRGGPSDGDTVFVFGGRPFQFLETEFDDLPSTADNANIRNETQF